jgi:RecG-like helicase
MRPGRPAALAIQEPRQTEIVSKVDGTQPIGSVNWREQVRVEGRVRTVRVQPMSGSGSLELVLEDDSGAISVVFLGRPRLGGVDVGTRMHVEGTAGMHHGRLAIVNPVYKLLIN